MKKKKKIIIIGTFISLIMSLSFGIISNQNKTYIDKVLVSDAYAYLPNEAKEYIKDVYDTKGEVFLTEKNKEENKAYLNPLYVSYLLMSNDEKDSVEVIPMPLIVDFSAPDVIETTTYPSSYDLRNVSGKNYVTPVRDQGNLGLCWAFASAEIAESYLLKTSNTSYSTSSTIISERQIDYATSTDGIKDYDNEYVTFVDRSLGEGGNFYVSSVAMASGISLVDSNSFKAYDDTDLGSEELSDVLSYNNSLYELDKTIIMPWLNLRESTGSLSTDDANTRTTFLNIVKENIMESGAAYVGTYMHSSCNYYDSNLNTYVIDDYNCSFVDSHAMTIIGWDDDLEYSYCADTNVHNADTSSCSNIVSGTGLWLLKNSWGANTQYLYLTYDSLYSSISFIKELDEAADKVWDNDYIIDLNNDAYYLGDTKILNDEKLNKIKFFALSSYTTYTITVTLEDGTEKTYIKESEMPGLLTIDITDNVIINNNATITITTDGSNLDTIMVFTSNVDFDPYISFNDYTEGVISLKQMRIYSETKNIDSGSLITYKIIDEGNYDYTSSVTFSNNEVAENNVNTLISFDSLSSGAYTVYAYYNSSMIGSFGFEYERMQGDGTENNPYIISSGTQLDQIRDNLSAYYELGNDIDLTADTREGGSLYHESDYCPGGFGWQSINNFTGSLDGKGHKIIGLYQNNLLECTKGKTWTLTGNGLFSVVSKNVTIKNLVLEDFDISCYRDSSLDCGALISNYSWSYPLDHDDTNAYSVNIQNIALKNSKITVKNKYSNGGLFGSLASNNEGSLNISNIYTDIYNKPITESGYLLYSIDYFKTVNLKNIQMLGNYDASYTDGSGSAALVYTISGNNQTVNIENVLSTLNNSNLGGTIGGYFWTDNIQAKNIYTIKVPNRNYLYRSNETTTFTNVNQYELGVNFSDLTNPSNYTNWPNFDNNWVIKTVDGIRRFPVLKFVDFKYSVFFDITLDYDIGEKINIYDLVYPNTDAAKRFVYSINDESIATIDENGLITPVRMGQTFIHIDSYYDGYQKDVPITVNASYYTIKFNSNNGIGTMNNFDVMLAETINLPENTFTKLGYTFNGWNTNSLGTGTSYTDMEEITSLASSESNITLYAQWTPITYNVVYNANGGTGSISNQLLTYDNLTKLTKNTFTKEGYTFKEWNTSSDGTGTSYNDEKEVKNLLSESGNFTLYAIWKEDFDYIINNYTVDEDLSIVENIPPNTTWNTFINNLLLNNNYTYNLPKSGEYIGTGSYLYIYKNDMIYRTLRAVILGDVNGDGRINSGDYVKIRKHIMGSEVINIVAISQSADVNKDNKITSADYIKIKKYIMNGGNL